MKIWQKKGTKVRDSIDRCDTMPYSTVRGRTGTRTPRTSADSRRR